jgi:hypothetical protein
MWKIHVDRTGEILHENKNPKGNEQEEVQGDEDKRILRMEQDLTYETIFFECFLLSCFVDKVTFY